MKGDQMLGKLDGFSLALAFAAGFLLAALLDELVIYRRGGLAR